MADLVRESSSFMIPPKTRADRVAPLAATFAASDLMRLSITDGGFSLEMVRRTIPTLQKPPPSEPMLTPVAQVEPSASEESPQRHVLRAELVGIVRWSEPRLAVGVKIESDRELLAIEALGVRTPVLAGGKGVVTELYITDGSPVEYGQALLVIEYV